MKKEVPNSLKTWFIIHFIVDYIVAIPLFIAPIWLFNVLGITNVDPLTARLVAAALLGVGGVSLYAHKKSKEVYDTLLTLKVIWGGSATIGILLTMILNNYNPLGWIMFTIFLLFSTVWIYYKFNFQKS